MRRPILSRRRRAAVASALAVAALVATALPAVAVPATQHELEQARDQLVRWGYAVGDDVEAAQVADLARRVQVPIGQVVDGPDVPRVVNGATRVGRDAVASAPADTHRRLEAAFQDLGVGYGTRVDHDDVLNLARRVRVDVGTRVDEPDIDRVLAAANRQRSAYAEFATVGGVVLRLPSARTEVVGFHESNHDGARQLSPISTGVRQTTLDSRGRGTGSRSAADIVAAADERILSPVSGRVLRAGTYTLYCKYTDSYAVIEPDGHPGWEVKLLHVTGLHVRAGDRVEAARTLVADRPTTFPFRSQVDSSSGPQDQPHVHLEVVDPSIPDRPSPGGGC